MFNGGIELIFKPINVDFCKFNLRFPRIHSMSTNNDTNYKMNLNEYMVTLEKPLGIRFALSVDGNVFVHSLRKGVGFLLF